MTTDVPAKSYDHDEKTRTAVDQLRFLVENLYPDPSPDIFTLKDFINRYPLTGLGNLATREIEQAQRINKSLDNYQNLGLCQFHIGLIYLYWGAFRGAVTQFQLARKNWNFTDAKASKSLCFFAEGNANYLSYHYEEAMRCYGLANNALERINPSFNEFYYQEISIYIKNGQTHARDAMWGRVRAKSTGESKENGRVEEPASQPQDEHFAESANNIPNEEVYVEEVVASPTSDVFEDDIPPPQIHLEPHPASIDMPLPGHDQPDENYIWYQVERRTADDLYENVLNGDWLLVNTRPSDGTIVEPDEPILVLMEKNVDNGIKIKSTRPSQQYQRIYLAKYDDFLGTFVRNPETGEVTFLHKEPHIKVTFSSQDQQISVQWSAIIGVVEGFWRGMHVR